MARKKTKKSADPAPEYIDSAGVKLNAASDLIIEANKSGDVISARNLINGVEYVGGGGGDFSEVKLTIINNAFTDFDANAPLKYNDNNESYAGYFTSIPQGNSTFDIILYKNKAVFYVTAFDNYEFILDENISYRWEQDYPEFIVTGNATLTINSKD